jgi:hypothetical protein
VPPSIPSSPDIIADAEAMARALREGMLPAGLWEGACEQCTAFYARNVNEINASVEALQATPAMAGKSRFHLLTTLFACVHLIPAPGHGDIAA